MEFIILDPACSDQWFSLTKEKPSKEELNRLSDSLSSGPLNPHLRLVAVDNNLVVAKCAARFYKKKGSVKIWHPLYIGITAEEDKQKIAGSFLNIIIDYSDKLSSAKWIEANPAYDVESNDLWVRSLISKGFNHISDQHLYEFEPLGEAINTEKSAFSNFSLVRDTNFASSELESLFQKTKIGTMDTVYHSTKQSFFDFVHTLGQSSKLKNDSIFVLKLIHHKVAYGFILLGLDEESDELAAWILDFGLKPEHRGKGFGRVLLQKAQKFALDRGITKLYSLIDDANLPSARTHLSSGFKRLEGKFTTYIKHLKGDRHV